MARRELPVFVEPYESRELRLDAVPCVDSAAGSGGGGGRGPLQDAGGEGMGGEADGFGMVG